MKKTGKRILATVLTVIMLMTAIPFAGIDFESVFAAKASALASSGKCGENVTWSFNSSTGQLTISGTGDMYNYFDPEEEYEYFYSNSPFTDDNNIKKIIIKYGVTNIGNASFYNCPNLTSITIPNSVTNIGYGAFVNCDSLTSVTIGNGITSIGGEAFANCDSLTSIIIPDSVTSIGYEAFSWCDSLASVTIGNGVTSIGDRAFCYGQSLTNVTIGDSVASIGEYTFSNCSNLKNVTIPDGVTSIGDGAFEACRSFTSITIPNSVASIGDYTFHNCDSLTSVTVDKNNHVYDSRNNCNAIIETATNTLIFGCQNTIIPDSVTSIGESAFESCDNLKNITIPSSITSIGEYAFSGCFGLTNITVDKNNPVYDSRNNCNAIIETASNTLIFGCQNTIIPDSVTGIGDWAFDSSYGLISITIPDNVTSIGENTFSDCSNLTSVTIPDSVTSIGDWAFSYCENLTIYCYENSTAHKYAIDNNIKYEIIGAPSEPDIILEKTDVTVAVGETIKVGKTFVTPNGERLTANYQSLDKNIATAKPDNGIVITGVAPGETRVKVKLSYTETGKLISEQYINVTVVPKPELKLEKTDVTVVAGETIKVGRTFVIPKGIKASAYYQSLDKNIATAKADNGISITGVAPGKTRVKVNLYYTETQQDISEQYIDVTVVLKPELKLSQTSVSMTEGEVITITRSPIVSEGTIIKYAYKNYNEDIVSYNGKDSTITLTALKCGTAKIDVCLVNADTDEKLDTKTITVTVSEVKLSVDMFIPDIQYTYSYTIKPDITIADGIKYTVKYESSNPSVAAVDKDGNITTVHKGDTVITCTVTDEYGNVAEATCPVNVYFSFGQWLIWILLLGFLWY